MEDKEEFLASRGWHTWYNDAYWVNKKVVANPKTQDYTNYVMSLDEAIAFERENKNPYEPKMDVYSQFNRVFKGEANESKD